MDITGAGGGGGGGGQQRKKLVRLNLPHSLAVIYFSFLAGRPRTQVVVVVVLVPVLVQWRLTWPN